MLLLKQYLNLTIHDLSSVKHKTASEENEITRHINTIGKINLSLRLNL